MKTKLSTENLCDYCDYNIPECGAENIEFGNGFGNDNVVTCDSFSGPYPEKTVYTEEEFQEAIKTEQEECALICEELLLYAGVKGETKALKEAAKQIRAK